MTLTLTRRLEHATGLLLLREPSREAARGIIGKKWHVKCICL